MSADINLSKTQISKITQSGGFLGTLLSKIAGPLMKIAVPFAKNISALLGSAIVAGTQKKIYGSGMTTLIISNEEMNDIMKIAQILEDSGILLKASLKQLETRPKSKTVDFC